MEVRIGIQSAPRELSVETSAPAEQIERDLAVALENRGLFVLPVGKGGKVLMPSDKIAYIEFTPHETRRVGFGNL